MGTSISSKSVNSLWHVGAIPSHEPLAKHSRVLLPMRLNPSSHVYVAMAPKVDMLKITDPLVGLGRESQSTTEGRDNLIPVIQTFHILVTYSHKQAPLDSNFH